MEPLPPPPFNSIARAPVPAVAAWTPTRLGVFGRILWRAALACIGGFGVVGFALGVGIAIESTEDTVGDRLGDPFIVAYVASAFGLFFAVVAAPIVAGLCCASMVPYPGRESARRRARFIAAGPLAVVSLAMVAGIDDDYRLAWAGVGLLSTAGAWLVGPLLVRWYVRRMEP